MSLVTIIIPTINRPKLLKRAINSIYEQNFKDDIEVYVIDSSTNNDTKILCENIPVKKNRKLSYVKNNNSKNPIDNYIIGSEYIRGEYSKFLCDDDWLEPDFLKESIYMMEEKNAACTISNINVIVSSKNKEEKKNNYYEIIDGEVGFSDIYDFIFEGKSIPTTDSASLMKAPKLKEAFLNSLKNLECTKLQYGFDFYINYYSVFDSTKTLHLSKSLVNSWAGDDSLTVNAKMSRISYCNFFAFLSLVDHFKVTLDHKTRDLIEHKFSIIRFKGIFSNRLKILTPESSYKSKIKTSLLFEGVINKIYIKIKYLIKA